jgi:hypothetical protein
MAIVSSRTYGHLLLLHIGMFVVVDSFQLARNNRILKPAYSIYSTVHHYYNSRWRRRPSYRRGIE